MQLIQSSHDILNLALAVCALLLAGFIAWFIYYLIMMLREVFKVTREMHDWINKVDRLIDALKEKAEHSTSYLILLGEGIKKMAELAMKINRTKRSAKAEKTKSKK